MNVKYVIENFEGSSSAKLYVALQKYLKNFR